MGRDLGGRGLIEPLEEPQQLAKPCLLLAKAKGMVGLEAGKRPFFLAGILLPAAGCRAELGLILNTAFPRRGEEHGEQTAVQGRVPPPHPLLRGATSTETPLPALNPSALGENQTLGSVSSTRTLHGHRRARGCGGAEPPRGVPGLVLGGKGTNSFWGRVPLAIAHVGGCVEPHVPARGLPTTLRWLRCRARQQDRGGGNPLHRWDRGCPGRPPPVSNG